MTDLRVTAARGELERHMRREAMAIDGATRAAVETETRQLQLAIRAQVDAVFPSRGRRKPGNAIRSKVYKREGGGYTGLIWSKFGRTDAGGQFVDYLLPWVQGATLRPQQGRYMVIPVRGTSRRVKRHLRDLARLNEDPKLRLIAGRGGKLFFVRQTRTRSTLIAVLVRRTRIPQRLRFENDVVAAEQALPRTLLRALEAREPA